MHDDNQKLQMSLAWDSFPIARAVKSIWIVMKYGKPAGRDGRDLIFDVDIAEKFEIKDFGKNLSAVAPANQYVRIPAMNGESAQIRFSKDLISVAGNSHSGHIARIIEANMNDSRIPFDTALGIALSSDQENHDRYPGLDHEAVAQKVVLNGSYQMLIEALQHSESYRNDLVAGTVIKDDIRTIRCAVGEHPVVMVTTTSGGQKSYTLELDELALTVLHGEMSGMVSDSPLAPTLEFPLREANYSAIFLRERGEVRLNVQWANEESRADDWSEKLVFK